MPLSSANETAAYRIPDGQAVVFDAVRLLATAAVFLGHATRPDVLVDVDISLFGRATIPIFLMLSGYLTAATMARGGPFWRKPLWRYLSLYYVVVPAVPILLIADLWLVHANSPLIENFKFVENFYFLSIVRETFDTLTYSGEY